MQPWKRRDTTSGTRAGGVMPGQVLDQLVELQNVVYADLRDVASAIAQRELPEVRP